MKDVHPIGRITQVAYARVVVAEIAAEQTGETRDVKRDGQIQNRSATQSSIEEPDSLLGSIQGFRAAPVRGESRRSALGSDDSVNK